MSARGSVATLLAFAGLLAGLAVAQSPMSLDPLLLMRGHSPTRLGTDAEGNLWGWNERQSRLLAVAADGALLAAYDAQPSRAVDFSAASGTVLLDLYGKRISWRDRHGEERASWSLQHEAADVAWVAPGRVAVSTTRSSPPIEVWDLERGKRLAAFGEAPAIEVRRGATLLRNLDLAYHAASDTLYALDSFEGDLEAYGLDGSIKGRHRLPNPRRDQLDRWLAEADRDARARGAVETPLFTVLGSAAASDGVAWVVIGCSENRRIASVEAWTPGRRPSRHSLVLPDACCSLAFTVWQDRLVFTHKPDTVAQRCVIDRRLP